MRVTKRIPFSDKQLLAAGPLKRYASFEATGIKLTDLPVSPDKMEQVQRWREKIARVLISKDKIRAETRATEGYRVDIDDALEGEAECFRMKRFLRPAPIKIGINLSGAAGSEEIQCIRGGAVLAFTDLCKKQGRKYTLEVCYGNGLQARHAGVCHVRVPLPAYVTAITHICLSNRTMETFGDRLVAPLARTININGTQGYWTGFYRFYEFEANGIHEFDFVLDRVETCSPEREYQRVLDRLIKLGVA